MSDFRITKIKPCTVRYCVQRMVSLSFIITTKGCSQKAWTRPTKYRIILLISGHKSFTPMKLPYSHYFVLNFTCNTREMQSTLASSCCRRSFYK